MKNKKVLAFICASTSILSMYGRMQTDKPTASVEPRPLLQQIHEESTTPPMKQRKKELLKKIEKLTKKIDQTTTNKERLQRHRDMLKRQLKELQITRS